MREFRWNAWNVGHIAEHDVAPDEVEHVVRSAKPPYPRHGRNDTWVVWGPTEDGRYLQIAYFIDENDEIYVIHARPLDDHEKRQLRRRRR